jgi:hypothetical protein
MNDMKVVISCGTGGNLVLTFTEDQASSLFSTAKYFGIPIESEAFGELALEFCELGHARSIRHTNKTREEIHQEIKRNYPDAMRLKKKEE